MSKHVHSYVPSELCTSLAQQPRVTLHRCSCSRSRGSAPRRKSRHAPAAVPEWGLGLRARQGRFLLATFQEVLDGIEPETGSLCEAYNDAVYFKWVAHPSSRETQAVGHHQLSAHCYFLQPCR